MDVSDWQKAQILELYNQYKSNLRFDNEYIPNENMRPMGHIAQFKSINTYDFHNVD